MVVVHANFAEVETVAQQHGFAGVHAILLDLGVSSFQLAEAERGFSWQADGPLDMRMNPDQEISAWDIVNTWPERDLADLIYEYGEERHSRRIARAIVARRPIERTGQLAELVESAQGGRRGQRIHPATRTFQALRIGVNQELSKLEQVLPQCLRLLRPGGRLAVIAFTAWRAASSNAGCSRGRLTSRRTQRTRWAAYPKRLPSPSSHANRSQRLTQNPAQPAQPLGQVKNRRTHSVARFSSQAGAVC